MQITHGQTGVGGGIFGVQLNRMLEVALGFEFAFFRIEVQALPPPQQIVVSRHTLGRLVCYPMAARMFDTPGQSGDDDIGDLILDFKDIVQIPVVVFGLNAMPSGRVNQLNRDPHAVAGLSQTALNNMRDPEMAPDLLHVGRVVPRGK